MPLVSLVKEDFKIVINLLHGPYVCKSNKLMLFVAKPAKALSLEIEAETRRFVGTRITDIAFELPS